MKINSEVRYASSPEDAKRYDTAELRRRYLIENVFSVDEVNMTYTMHDRMIAGGAMPVNEPLELKPIDILRADYFLERREMGIFNVGDKGIVTPATTSTNSTTKRPFTSDVEAGK